MSFSERAKLIALAIVHVFETSHPFGGYGEVAVLNDGAGVSYGINQFTHRSGFLHKVVNTYLGLGGEIGADVLKARLPILWRTDSQAVITLANDKPFKDALRMAGATDEMRLAQAQIAENFILQPAIEACEGSGFVLPLSFAVVYDSKNHGSFDKIRDRVPASLPEKQWITRYVQERHAWLRSSPKLKTTSYRTRFFLDEIEDNNWNLDLPLAVHGTALTEAMFPPDDSPTSSEPAPDPPARNDEQDPPTPVKATGDDTATDQPQTQAPIASMSQTTTTGADGSTNSTTTQTVQPVTLETSPPPSFIQEVSTTLTTKITAISTFLGGLGILGTQLMQKAQDALSEHIGLIVGIGLVALGVYYLKTRQDKAHETQLALIQAAANPLTSTVTVLKPKALADFTGYKAGQWRNVEYGERKQPTSITA